MIMTMVGQRRRCEHDQRAGGSHLTQALLAGILSAGVDKICRITKKAGDRNSHGSSGLWLHQRYPYRDAERPNVEVVVVISRDW
jgi:hypothetical protein